MGVKVTHSSTGLPSINSNSYCFLVENIASSRHGCYTGTEHLPPLLLQSVFGLKLSLSHLIMPTLPPHSHPPMYLTVSPSRLCTYYLQEYLEHLLLPILHRWTPTQPSQVNSKAASPEKPSWLPFLRYPPYYSLHNTSPPSASSQTHTFVCWVGTFNFCFPHQSAGSREWGTISFLFQLIIPVPSTLPGTEGAPSPFIFVEQINE